MRSFHFTIKGIPQPQGRPRAAYRGGRVIMYDPAASRAWKKEIQRQMPRPYGEKHGDPVLETSLVLYAHFYLPRPKSNKSKHHTTRPDCSNLVKALEDAMESVIYKNDSQIVSLIVTKRYVNEQNPEPCVMVTVSEYELDT